MPTSRRNTVAPLTLLALLAAPSLSAQRAPAALHLGLAGQLENPPPQSQLAAGAGVLVARGNSPRHLVTYDPATLRQLADLSAAPGTPRWMHQSDTLLVGSRLLGASAGSVLALDVHDGRELFRTRIAPVGESFFWPHSVALEGAGLWAAAAYHFVPGRDEEAPATRISYELIVLRLADGALLWRAPADGNTQLAQDGTRLFTLDNAGTLRALDALTGALRWSYALRLDTQGSQCGYPSSMLAHQGRVVVGCGNGSALVFDAAAGGAPAALALAPGAFVRPVAAWEGGVVLGARERSSGRGARSWLVAMGLSPPRVLWRSAQRRTEGGEHRGVAVAGEWLFHCGEAGVLEAVTLAQGAPAWSWGVGRCESLAVTGAGAAMRVFVSLGDRVSVFSAGAPEAAVESARIEGVVTVNGAPWGGVELRVGTEAVTADAQGRYGITVRARGVVTVAVVSAVPRGPEVHGDMVFGGEASVALDGRRGAYTASLAATVGTIEFAGPQPGH